ncbi:hypothetical protein I5504_07605 [Citrobacter koseri]|uniref:hypothetical protein n=1 Tax=Citrobacter koseri TaxID=545 RepID=UPI001900EC38|nr:hypothetical protein [Citrobacter koseri]MBJ9302921.1 hypothetical protein [Citrobacter koseri]MBJ9367427.1 hypothetical protein [Citrobacter koseri]
MSVYLDVDRMVRNVDHGDVTRETLFQQRSRYKKQGKTAEVEAITRALELTKCAASGVLRQAQRLAVNFDGMDAEKALELKATVAAYASKSTDLQASIVLAFQSLFEAKGVPMEYDEVLAYLMLKASADFEDMAGELPVIVH